MMYGNYGFYSPSSYKGQPCDKPLGIGPRIKAGVSVLNEVALISILAPYVAIPTVFFITPLLSKVVLKDAPYKERLWKSNATLLALLAVYNSFDEANRFKQRCKVRAERTEGIRARLVRR